MELRFSSDSEGFDSIRIPELRFSSVSEGLPFLSVLRVLIRFRFQEASIWFDSDSCSCDSVSVQGSLNWFWFRGLQFNFILFGALRFISVSIQLVDIQSDSVGYYSIPFWGLRFDSVLIQRLLIWFWFRGLQFDFVSDSGGSGFDSGIWFQSVWIWFRG